MEIDVILASFQRHQADAILVGGMNFFLRHQPVTTFDLDLWVPDTPENLARVNMALVELGAQWGADDTTWGPVPNDPAWLQRQSVFCLTTRHGAVDIFRELRGLEGKFAECRDRATLQKTGQGTPYLSLSDPDMLACQLALPEHARRLDRVRYLTQLLQKQP